MVQKKIKTVIWSKNAEIQYYKILEYLHEESPEIIKTIASNLLDTIEETAIRILRIRHTSREPLTY